MLPLAECDARDAADAIGDKRRGIADAELPGGGEHDATSGEEGGRRTDGGERQSRQHETGADGGEAAQKKERSDRKDCAQREEHERSAGGGPGRAPESFG